MASIENILTDIGLLNLLPRFNEEKVDINIVMAATDEDLKRLGVQRLGDRIRLKDMCRQKNSNSREGPSSRIREERRTLFAPYARQTNGNCSRSSSSSKPNGRSKKAKKRTWTGQFVCLADRTRTKLPTPSEKQVLHNAGLGLKKISFDIDDDETDVYTKLMADAQNKENGETEGFPTLKHCGGFELLKCIPNCRILEPLNCKLNSISLKATIGQGKIYIRPIQKSLSVIPLQKASTVTTSIKEKCLNCFEEFCLEELRQHTELCMPYYESSDDSEVALPPVLSNEVTHEEENNEITETESAFRISYEYIPETRDQKQDNANNNEEFDLNANINNIISYCIDNQVNSPVEILRYMQQKLVQGRSLEITDIAVHDDRPTNFIMVDRANLIETGLEEIRELQNKLICLSVQFYGELAEDYGGPRKEFFQQIIREIKEKYFDCEINLFPLSDYYDIGIVFGLSLLQNGPFPQFLEEDDLQKIFFNEEPGKFNELRRAFKDLGIFQIVEAFPIMLHLFRPNPNATFTFKKLVNLLQPKWAAEGSNEHYRQKKLYPSLMKYLRQAHGGKRSGVSLPDVLRFVTGSEEEPLLGFALAPSIKFVPVMEEGRFLPTSNTCINQLQLPMESNAISLPDENALFGLYDLAFSSRFFGQI
ncbi:uncharacterized protein LOC130647115 [Hydractinia symbiolongicarpus]|uniref:uncharacterized protein LOC130613258 n=1 Tax=Hydractinia symbiolongicarpus TaxID=13093 RepID=UPI00254FC761|nr:uncharacterized protein LOC130613258 [Hydractinia symbiolongicarpus]XP_057294825.1 uncharacterized protein LOC130623367 [Hydractinia symbiolongicarpus]XP_057303864.1 uncharacterized protein LOC130641188 [Hydractinia symbiolongicarpus]XP_057308837.1 uncharacterized protein LOC130647115 [Hydractinia symbiolongicarpus]